MAIAQRLKQLFLWDTDFTRSFFRLAIPILAQQFLASMLHMVDTIMIGQLGEMELAAVNQANRLTFVFMLFLFGAMSASSIFASQYWGKGEMDGIHRSLGMALLCGEIIMGIAWGIALFFPQPLMHMLASSDEQVVQAGCIYLQTVSFSYLLVAISQAYSTINKATERAWLPLIGSISSILTNIVLNYALIFGKLGFPAMGIRGGAIATVIAAGVQVAVLLVGTYALHYPAASKLSSMFRFPKGFVQHYMKTSLPVIFNEGGWGLGMMMYSVVYGHMGKSVMAASGLYMMIEDFVFVFVLGVMNAGAVLIGKALGAQEEDVAWLTAKRMLFVGTLMGLLIGVIIMAFRWQIVGSFSGLSSEALRTSASMLVVMGCCCALKAFNAINVVGVLRSGGDTVFSMMLDLLCVWGIGVPLCYISGVLLHWPIASVLLLTYGEELIKLLIGGHRFKSGKWLRSILFTSSQKEVLSSEFV